MGHQVVSPEAEDGSAPVLPADFARSSHQSASPDAAGMKQPEMDAISDDYRVGYNRTCGCFAEVSPWAAKWMYFIGFSIFSVVSWIFRDYSDKIFKNIKGLDACLGLEGTENSTFFTGVGNCVGKGAVLRISFGSFLFFAAHLVALIGVTNKHNRRRLVHTGCWPAQLALWLVLIGACFAMPNSVFSAVGQAFKVFAGLFLVLVVVIFVDWFYQINEWLLVRSDGKRACTALVAGTLLFYLGSVIAIIFMFRSYAPKASCGANIAFLSLTLIGAVIYTAISVSPWRPKSAGVFSSGCIFIYCTYLCWGALSSQPAGDCVPKSASSLPIQILGFLIAIASVLFTCWDTTGQDKAFIRNMKHPGLPDHHQPDRLPHNPAWVHAVFMLASAYMAMVLTNWTLADGPNPWQIDRGSFSSWVRIASQWLCGAFYTWTLCAPLVLRTRVFD